MATELWAIGLTILAQMLGSLTPVFLKKASSAMSLSIKSLKNKDLWVAIIAQFISMVMFVVALKGGELSFIYPLVSTVYIWSSFLSVRMLGETMNTKKWLGIACIIVGVTLIGIGS